VASTLATLIFIPVLYYGAHSWLERRGTKDLKAALPA
jgi:hypothetical protein